MTLREKFKTKEAIQFEGEARAHAVYCEKITDDFTIEFSEWLDISDEPQKYYKKNSSKLQPIMDGSHNIYIKEMS